MSESSNRRLPGRPSLEHLKKAAKKRLKAMRAKDGGAALAGAQLAVAREYGFASWRRLKAHVDGAAAVGAAARAGEVDAAVAEFLLAATSFSTDPDPRAYANAKDLLAKTPAIAGEFLAACVLGDAKGVGRHLEAEPGLARRRGGPRDWEGLLYLAFSRFLRHEKGREPAFVRVAKMLVEAGADANSFFVHEGFNETALYGAAGVANAPRLTKFLLEVGADPTDRAKDNGPESLYHACEHLDNACLRHILRKGPRRDAVSYCLFRKLDFEDASGVRLMIGHGADVNFRGPGYSPSNTHLIHAVLRGRSPEVLGILVEAGAEIDAKNALGQSAVALARRLGQKEAAAFLIARGAATAADVKEEFLAACAAGDLRAAKKALGADRELVSKLTADDLAVLPAAAAAGGVWPVRHMLNLGFPIDAPGDWGASAAHQAAWHGHVGLLKFLLKRGASPHVKQGFGGNLLSTAIHGASHGGHSNGEEVVAVAARAVGPEDFGTYIKHAENLGHEGVTAVLRSLARTGRAPSKPRGAKRSKWQGIMNAAFLGNWAIVKAQLAAGVDPNVVSPTAHRHRPLHRAIEEKKLTPRTASHEEVVRVLLDAGADPALRGTLGRFTALQLSAVGDPRFVPLLRGRFEPLDVFHAAVCLDAGRVEELLGWDAALAKARDVNGWTALHYAAASAVFATSPARADAQERIVRGLVARGAAVGAAYYFDEGQEKWPIPVLYHACGAKDNPRLTALLLELGADPFDGESLYHAADEGHEGCLKVLEERCDPARLAAECTRALPVQLHWGRVRGVGWLLGHGADPNALGERYGGSALHEAIESRRSEAVLVELLRHGADPAVKNRDGKDARGVARAVGKEGIERLERAVREARRRQ